MIKIFNLKDASEMENFTKFWKSKYLYFAIYNDWLISFYELMGKASIFLSYFSKSQR